MVIGGGAAFLLGREMEHQPDLQNPAAARRLTDPQVQDRLLQVPLTELLHYVADLVGEGRISFDQYGRFNDQIARELEAYNRAWTLAYTAMEPIQVRFEQGEPRMARIETTQPPAADPQRLTAAMVRQLVRWLNAQETPLQLTPAEQAEQDLYRQAVQRRVERRERERAAARERATTLLLEKLSPVQRRTWAEQQFVEVRGSQTKRLYRIHDRGDDSYSMNVDCPESGYTYCAYPKNAHELPMADVVLAQMLWLTTDEDEFLRMANSYPYRGADSARYQPGWIDERHENAYTNINDYINVFYDAAWVPPRNDQGQYVVWTRTAERPRRQEPLDRDGVEAWIPDCCVERGCELTINRTDNPRDLFPCITIDHVDAARAFHLVLPPSRDWDTRGIRRYLQNALHRA